MLGSKPGLLASLIGDQGPESEERISSVFVHLTTKLMIVFDGDWLACDDGELYNWFG